MGKRNNKSFSKRSAGRLPKGLPVRKQTGANNNSSSALNPFETVAHNKRPKHAVHNKNVRPSTASAPATASAVDRPSALARALEQRKAGIKAEALSKQKANVFTDRRIGEYDARMTAEDRKMARLVRERSQRSKRASKYSLDGDDDDADRGGGKDKNRLTHKGKSVDRLTDADHRDAAFANDDGDDDELYYGDGDAKFLDADLHFGGGGVHQQRQRREQMDVYGGGGGGGANGDGGGPPTNLVDHYSKRKLELDDLIKRRRLHKMERQKSREDQVEVIAGLDESFKELAGLLHFRDPRLQQQHALLAETADQQGEPGANNRAAQKKREEPVDDGADEMAEWDREMKQFQYLERKVKATDRTKTPEEIASEEAERLHTLETRRLARMQGDFLDDDDLTDISVSDGDDDGEEKKKRKSNAKQRKKQNPEALDNDSDDESTGSKKDELRTRFTADGLVRIDKDGVVVGKVGEEKADEDEDEEEENDDESASSSSDGSTKILEVGTRVSACFHAKEQFQGLECWYAGVVSKVNRSRSGGTTAVTYDIQYDDDDDFEEGVEPQHVKVVAGGKSDDELEREAKDKSKRRKAKAKARTEIPYVFEVPTTLEALHDLIATYASTGEDASLIIRRVHKSNSVKLDKRNMEKMQNFNDVLLRRFVAVGDAIFDSGDGGAELGRYRQLDALTETLYGLAHDAPDSAGAVWSRRLGFLQNAHAKRLRDAELVEQDGQDDDDEGKLITAWPSTGVFLTLRALGHIFPVTDRRHPVVTPALLLLGEFVAHTPIESMYDLVMGTMCAGLLLEYTKESKRVVPEALAFFAGVIRLFAPAAAQRPEMFPHPSLGVAASQEPFLSFRSNALRYDGKEIPRLSLHGDGIEKETGVGVLAAVLLLVEGLVTNLGDGTLASAETECFSEITNSLLALQPKKSKKESFPQILQKRIAATVSAVSDACGHDRPRLPLQRRPAPSARETAIKTLAPRLENPDRYSFSRDKGKDPTQAALDRTRRELKREHKAISRELRLDGAIVEEGRRQEKNKKDSAAKAKRHKAFAWMESEQGVMNEQVRQGGGLLQGGGTGAARAKAKTGQLGMKKGSKF